MRYNAGFMRNYNQFFDLDQPQQSKRALITRSNTPQPVVEPKYSQLLKGTRSFIDLPRTKSPYRLQRKERPAASSRLSFREFESKRQEITPSPPLRPQINPAWRAVGPTEGVFGFQFNK